MEHGALQDPLETQGWLGFTVGLTGRNQGRGSIQKLLQFFPQITCISATGSQHIDCDCIIQQRQQ